jgi:membrane-bound lytic murein transglycosylase D
LLVIGCAPAVKVGHVEQQRPDIFEMPADIGAIGDAAADEADPTEPEPPAVDETAAIDLTDIDGLLRSARAYCGDSLFAAADTALRRAAAFLMKNSLEAEGQWLPMEDYIADIISIYAESMPPAFSVPEEISTLIFKQHLLESLLDTLKISPQDSVFLARLSGKRGVVYDVPMVWNDRVKRALLFYTRSRKGVFDRWLNRAGYYLPVMRQMFADEGLPQDLAYLPIIESGFNPHAYSRAHAAGIWQFIPSTGRIYGLRQNYWLDERRDPLKSTGAAINYLRKLYGDFGDWHIALASYNCGEGGMSRAIRRAGGVRDYWALSLPKETMNYVPLYLASVMIAKNPDVFEFAIQDTAVLDLDTVSVNDCIEMKTIAEGIGVGLEIGRAHV